MLLPFHFVVINVFLLFFHLFILFILCFFGEKTCGVAPRIFQSLYVFTFFFCVLRFTQFCNGYACVHVQPKALRILCVHGKLPNDRTRRRCEGQRGGRPQREDSFRRACDPAGFMIPGTSTAERGARGRESNLQHSHALGLFFPKNKKYTSTFDMIYSKKYGVNAYAPTNKEWYSSENPPTAHTHILRSICLHTSQRDIADVS